MISIDLSVVVWTVVNFALLMLLLDRFLYKPLLTFMKKRQARVDAGLEARRQALARQEAEAERLRSQQSQRMLEERALTQQATEQRRVQARARREQAAEDAAAKQEQAKQALRQEQETLLARLRDKLPLLTQALGRELLEPLDPAPPRDGPAAPTRYPRRLGQPTQAQKSDGGEGHALLEQVERRLPDMERALDNKLLEPVK